MGKRNHQQRMTRRHFAEHLLGAAAMAVPAITFTNALRANAATLKKNERSAILLWMSGGPSTIDIWDLKPGSVNGGPFQPSTRPARGRSANTCRKRPS